MPLALDPQETFELVLESDQGKAEPPAFIFRYLTNREWKQVAGVGDLVSEMKEQGLEPMLEAIESALRIGLVGWKNLKDRDGNEIPYNSELVEEVLMQAEIWELIFALRDKTSLGHMDKKKSESPSPSNTDSSVEPASLPKAAEQDPQN